MPYYRCGMRDPLVSPHNLYSTAPNVLGNVASRHEILAVVHVDCEHSAAADECGAVRHPQVEDPIEDVCCWVHRQLARLLGVFHSLTLLPK